MMMRRQKNSNETACMLKRAGKLRQLFLMALMITVICVMTAGTVSAEPMEGPAQFDNLDSRGASVIEANTNTYLYGKNGDKKFYPASTTKVLTAITVLENAKDLDKVTTVSDNAVNGIDPSSSHIALDVGEKVTIRQLLYGLILCSGNDCAVALAEEVGGSIKDFAKMMNDTAQKIGATNSHFVNPHGLYSKQHYTTPNDLAKIMSYCIKNDQFVEILKTIKFVIPKTNKSKKRELWNNHRLIKYKYKYYKGVVGGKTGYIDESGFNLITYAKRGDLDIITVCMRASGMSAIDDDTIRLLNRYLKKYHLDTVKAKDAPEAKKKLEDKNVNAGLEKDITVVLPKSATASDVKIEESFSENVKLPLKEGQTVGAVKCVFNNKPVGEGALVSKDDYETRQQTMTRKIAIGAGCALALVLVLIIVWRVRKKNKDQGSKA